MERKNVQFSTIIDGVNAKKDGTLTIKLGTQELPEEETAHIFALRGNQIWCALSPLAVRPEDISIPEQVLEANDKSPSQRLRSVLWVLWDQGDKTVDADTFYRQQMEKFISHVKEKLS